MNPKSVRALSTFAGAVLVLASPAWAVDVPLRNWAPPIANDLGKQVDVTQAVPFVGMEPCRLVDTRPSQGFPAAWGPPALVANATRNFDLDAAPHCTGIPGGVEAYSLNITVAEPAGPGDLRIYPQGSPPATPTSLMNWSQSGPAFAIANAAIVPAGTGAGVTVQMAGTSGHVIIDINGYWTDNGNDGITLDYHADDSIYVAHFFNTHTASACNGVQGETSSSVNSSAGVRGIATGATGRTYGVWGTTDSTLDDSAGVRGVDNSGSPPGNTGWQPSGVLGESTNGYGVLGLGGLGTISAVVGRKFDGTGAQTSAGFLGHAAAGVFYQGGLSGNGTKNFLEPHPTDPSKALKYVSLEGPEAGTYFRGKGRFDRGIAQIEIPEDFRMVTSEEGLSIQVTPIGDMASVAVMRIGLDGIVVKGSRNVEFFYTVNGVRRAYPTWNPVVENQYFQPESPSMAFPLYFSPDERQRLIANGTYHADGSVNLETAKRLGWDKRWAPKEQKPVVDSGAHSPPR